MGAPVGGNELGEESVSKLFKISGRVYWTATDAMTIQ